MRFKITTTDKKHINDQKKKKGGMEKRRGFKFENNCIMP
jgi:hypothetical protein